MAICDIGCLGAVGRIFNHNRTIGIFKIKLNNQGKWATQLSGAAYGVFIIHPFVVVTLSAILKDWEVYPVLKFVILAPAALFLCFSIGLLLKKIPVSQSDHLIFSDQPEISRRKNLKLNLINRKILVQRLNIN